MLSYNPNTPLMSFHIPKCAGTSFKTILKSWFKDGYIECYYDSKENTQPSLHNLYEDNNKQLFKKSICINGHMNEKLRNAYYPEVDQFISILRHPFDVHLSFYFYVKTLFLDGREFQPFDTLQYEIIHKNWNVEQYLTNVKNSHILKSLPLGINLDNYQQVIDEKFLFIGIAEDLQASVDMLANILGYPSINVPKENASKWAEDIPSDALAEFIFNNPLEMAIYNYVKEKFLHQLKKFQEQPVDNIQQAINTTQSFEIATSELEQQTQQLEKYIKKQLQSTTISEENKTLALHTSLLHQELERYFKLKQKLEQQLDKQKHIEQQLQLMQLKEKRYKPPFYYEMVALKFEQDLADYEHLWFELSNVHFEIKSWPIFEFRVGAMLLENGQLSQHIKLEFPRMKHFDHQLEGWFAESIDGFGEKFELRFDTQLQILDPGVWYNLPPSDKKLIICIIEDLPIIFKFLQQQTDTVISRSWSDWFKVHSKITSISARYFKT